MPSLASSCWSTMRQGNHPGSMTLDLSNISSFRPSKPSLSPETRQPPKRHHLLPYPQSNAFQGCQTTVFEVSETGSPVISTPSPILQTYSPSLGVCSSSMNDCKDEFLDGGITRQSSTGPSQIGMGGLLIRHSEITFELAWEQETSKDESMKMAR